MVPPKCKNIVYLYIYLSIHLSVYLSIYLSIYLSREENGVGARAKDEDDSHVVLIQTVLDRAMKKDCLVNEVFLQLIKQV